MNPNITELIHQEGNITHQPPIRKNLSFEECNPRAIEVSLPDGAELFSRKKLCQMIGYGEHAIPEHFNDIINEIVKQLPDKCAIRGGYRIVSLSPKNGRSDGLLINESFFTMERTITAQLRKARAAAIFVCTIGEIMEKWSAKLFSYGDAVAGYFVDTIASVVAESAADHLHLHIEKEMRSHALQVTNRYSPGYCGWSVAEQQQLFSLLPPGFCNITLTDSSLMMPQKSVSGIIGIGVDVEKEPYSCEKCKKTSCTYRLYLSAQTIKRNTR